MPEIPDSILFMLAVVIIFNIIGVSRILHGKKARFVDAGEIQKNPMPLPSDYFYQDSDGYSIVFSEKEIKVLRSDDKPSILFNLKPYKLNGKDYVFLEITDFGEGVDLERMVTPLDNIFFALEADKLFHIIFSFKKVLYLSDLAFSLLPFHMQKIDDNGGSIIFCNVDPKIINTMDIMGFTELVKFYPSEAEMLEKETT